ncbi:MAG: methyl-accepting chemotaxis protein, partial [Desulfovibrionaceae bacterium]
MLKNCRLGIRLGIGFGLVLALTVAVAVVGYGGLQAAKNGEARLGAVNHIVEQILQCRRQEKNYIIRRDEASLANYSKALKDLFETAETLRGTFDAPADLARVDELVTSVKGYDQGFQQLVVLYGERDKAMEAMRGMAREALAQAEALRADQKRLLSVLLGAGALNLAAVEDHLDKADDANR